MLVKYRLIPFLDQFIRIEEGRGIVQMGDSRAILNISAVDDDYIIIIPAANGIT